MPSTAPNRTANPAAENGSTRMESTGECDGNYRAKRYAVKFEPPCVFLEYEDSNKRRRVRAVKLNGVQANVDVDRLTRKVIRSFPRKLDPTSVKYDQVRRLVVSLVDFLNGGTTPHNGANGTASAAAGAPGALSRNGSATHGPSRLGPGGGGGGAAAATKLPGRLEGLEGLASRGSISTPIASASPRVAPLELRNGHAARLAAIASTNGAGCRGSVESTMSRFSTSTASASSSSRGSSSSGEVPEEDEQGRSGDGTEEDDASPKASGTGAGGRPATSGLLSALDELEREMAGAPASLSDTSMTANGGGSSEMDSRASSFSVVDRSMPPSLAATPGPSRLNSIDPHHGGPGPAPGALLGGVGGASMKSRFAAEAEKLTIGLQVTDELDLNKVTDVELKMAKAAMEQDFKKNQLKPGDPGYEYDRQLEFGPPTEDNDWDESEDEDEGRSEDPEVDWADIHASVSKPKGTFSAVQLHASGLSSGDDSAGGRNSHSPYNSNDWP